MGCWGVDDNCLCVLVDSCFKCCKINLEIFFAALYFNALHTSLSDENSVLREEWSKCDNLVAFLRKSVKCDCKGSCSTAGHIEIVSGAFTAVSILHIISASLTYTCVTLS